MRPGYGLAVDDWRVAQTWTTLQGKFAHAAADVRVEGWILWRRIGGGLAAGQQQALAEPLLGPVRSLHRQLTTGKGRSDFGFAIHETAEMWRLLGSLGTASAGREERTGRDAAGPAAQAKDGAGAAGHDLGDRAAGGTRAALRAAERGRPGRDGRRLARAGSSALRTADPDRQLAVMQLARRTDDRYRDLPDKLRAARPSIGSRCTTRRGISSSWSATGGTLDSEEQGLVFGESLPKGLRIA